MGPEARSDRLLIESFTDEAVIYDLQNDDVHHLRDTALAVWRCCDGERSVEAIAAEIGETPGAVEAALVELRGAGLLVAAGPVAAGTTLDRRDLVRRVGLAGAAVAAVPMVRTIAAPTPAMAASPPAPTTGPPGVVVPPLPWTPDTTAPAPTAPGTTVPAPGTSAPGTTAVVPTTPTTAPVTTPTTATPSTAVTPTSGPTSTGPGVS